MKRKSKYWIGIDLGGTKILTVLFNSKWKPVTIQKTKTPTGRGEKHFIKILSHCITNILKEKKVRANNLGAVGIAVPGLVDISKGIVRTCPNLPFLKNCPLAKLMSKKFKTRVVIENDVNAGLYGEFRFGSARGFQHVVGIFPGTGIGGALILNGKLYRGATGGAGEIGHLPAVPEGPLCGCGSRGCLEAVAGRLAIASEASALALKQQAPKLYRTTGTDVAKIKSGALKKAIRAGDSAVESLVRSKARVIGRAVGGTINLLNPELVVLGGGLVEAMPKIFLEEITDSVKEHTMPVLSKAVRIVTAKLRDIATAKGVGKIAEESFKEGKSDD